MDLNDVFHSDSLKAADLKGRDVPLVIERYEVADFDDGKKLVLHFRGTDRTLVCNKTNANTIADMYGSDLDVWIGKKIVLFPSQTDFQGKQVACIRVRLGGAMPATVQEKFNTSAPDQPREEPATDLSAADESVPF